MTEIFKKFGKMLKFLLRAIDVRLGSILLKKSAVAAQMIC